MRVFAVHTWFSLWVEAGSSRGAVALGGLLEEVCIAGGISPGQGIVL